MENTPTPALAQLLQDLHNAHGEMFNGLAAAGFPNPMDIMNIPTDRDTISALFNFEDKDNHASRSR